MTTSYAELSDSELLQLYHSKKEQVAMLDSTQHAYKILANSKSK